MATTSNKINLSGLARKLVIDEILEESVAQQAFEESISKKVPFVSHLVENKLAKSSDIAVAAAEEFGMPVVDIDNVELDIDTIKLVESKTLTKHNCLPIFKRGNRLFVAVSDPMNIQALDDIKFATGTNTEAILVEQDKLSKAIEKAAEEAEGGLDGMDMDDDDLENLDNLEVADTEAPQEDDSSVDDAPVVRFVNKVLTDAIKRGASDIHFEPYEKFYRVRFRIDGVLTEVIRPPLALSMKIAARIKVMSRLDVSERRVPQDGRIKLKLSKTKSIDFRVSTCPTLFGEKTVMRILDSAAASLGIEMLGYEDFQEEIFLRNLEKPYGMFIVTGPTGSGKTVSLYTGINILNTEGVNISTAEDPVEINLPGINQVQIDEKTGMDFPKALKAFLRQDPDIILVGEIRDITTGGIAFKAAQTGHMVMSTLHTNDAPQTLTRLMDMGIAPFAIATAVNVIVAQRLARRLCKLCKEPADMPRDYLLDQGFTEEQLDAGPSIFKAVGCDECSDGYKGRTGVYQVMEISDAMKRLIMNGANSIDIADQADKEGIPDIRKSGLKKVLDGITSLEEINRVTQD